VEGGTLPHNSSMTPPSWNIESIASGRQRDERRAVSLWAA
jgi:hypothetical protein